MQNESNIQINYYTANDTCRQIKQSRYVCGIRTAGTLRSAAFKLELMKNAVTKRRGFLLSSGKSDVDDKEYRQSTVLTG